MEQARYDAATSMNKIVSSLKASGIEDKDIQTRYFNISPQYIWEEVVEDGRRRSKQILTGYQVNHNLQVKIRDLDEGRVGIVIDQAVVAGGDNSRINSIQFTIEDSYAAQNQARELALHNPHLSSSFLERRLRVGGQRADQIIEQLEEEGLVLLK